jgi:geranylgeranyl reductase family protein
MPASGCLCAKYHEFGNFEQVSTDAQHAYIPDMKINTEVLVIGCGPAGSACARTLAGSGVEVIAIDQRQFPRDKLCGGLITERSRDVFQKIFATELDETLLLTGEGIDFLQKGKKLASAAKDSPRLYFTMRRNFDHYLLSLAEQVGAKTILGHKIKKLDIIAKTALLDNGTLIEFKFLVGADGVNSKVAKALYGHSFNRETVGFCLEVEVPRADMPDHRDTPEIDFGAANWGYGWVFPKRKTFTIGAGGLNGKNPDMQANLEKVFADRGLDLSNYKIKGHFIPFKDFRERPAKNSVLLCGDAAGFVDPITGEGIAHAMDSGYLAAKAVVQTKQQGALSADRAYIAEVRPIVSMLRHALFIRNFIFPKGVEKSFARFFPKALILQKGFLDILAGKHGYRYFYYLCLVQLTVFAKNTIRTLLTKLGLRRA